MALCPMCGSESRVRSTSTFRESDTGTQSRGVLIRSAYERALVDFPLPAVQAKWGPYQGYALVNSIVFRARRCKSTKCYCNFSTTELPEKLVAMLRDTQ